MLGVLICMGVYNEMSLGLGKGKSTSGLKSGKKGTIPSPAPGKIKKNYNQVDFLTFHDLILESTSISNCNEQV